MKQLLDFLAAFLRIIFLALLLKYLTNGMINLLQILIPIMIN